MAGSAPARAATLLAFDWHAAGIVADIGGGNGRPDRSRGRRGGRVVEVYVSLKPGFEAGKEMENKVSKAIETEIGKIARLKNVWIVPDMPKPGRARSCAG